MIKNYKFLTKVAMLLLTFLIPLAGWGQTYEMTTSLVAGDEVVLVNTSVTKELGSITTSGTTYGTAVDVENSTPVGSNLLTVVAGFTEGSFAFKTSNGKYLSWSSGNSLTSADEVTNASSWTITFDDEGNATVTNVGTTARILSYNSSSPRFACYGNMNQQRVRFYKKESAASDAPSITASNVNIDYDATEGDIAYTINNGVDGGVLSASVTEGNWLTLNDTSFESPIAFSCEANDGAERTATVTLTYSYGDNETVTKDVTVTQAAYVPTVPGYEIDFENEATQYTDWTFTNMESKQTGNGNVTAHGGTYYGTTGGKASASITTKTKIATPYTLTCYVTKQSNNTAASNWKIEVSSDGEVWTTVKEQSATSMTAGTWVELTASLTNYTDVYVRVSYSGSTAVRNIDDLTLVTEIPTSPLINAENPAELAYDATAGAIEYTITNPVTGGSLNANVTTGDWLTIGTIGESSVQFTCEANEGVKRTATVTLIYTYGNDTATKEVTVTQAANPNRPGTENNPYTVAQAREAIDNNTDITGVYAMGIVSEIVTPLNTEYGNITYNISADGTTTADQLQAYRGKSYDGGNFTSEDDIKVGDEVVVYGNLKKYNNTYEFDANNQLVSLHRPATTEPTITLEQTIVNVDALGAASTIGVTYENFGENLDYMLFFQDATGAPADFDWLHANFDNDHNIEFDVDANQSEEPRTAYLKVHVADQDAKEVYYSDVITFSQAGNIPKYTVNFLTDGGTFVPNNDFTNDNVVIEKGKYALPSATKDGFKLQGWNDGNMVYAAGSEYDFTADVDFTAVWVEKGNEYYALVTNTADITDGEYLIVYENENGSLAFDGGLETLDAIGNVISVTIDNNEIESNDVTNAASFTIESIEGGYSIKSKSGYYIGRTASTNGLNSNETTVYTNTISIDDNMNAVITSSGGPILRFNSASNQNRFRYYATGQQAIQLYKKVSLAPTTVKITIKDGFKATTYSCDKALDFTGQNIAAYIITNENGATTRVTKVPANTGLYIERGDTDGTISYDIPFLTNVMEADDVTVNWLEATDGSTVYSSGNTTYYAFGKQNGKEAFYKVPISGYTPSANKAVLKVGSWEFFGAKEMIEIHTGVTGIESIENGTIVNDNYYTIDGKLVKGQPTQKGIYVVNGRKVVIK